MYKLETTPIEDNQEVSLYENIIIQDINGKDIETRECIGVFSIKDLEYEKLQLESQIKSINEKIKVMKL